MRAPGSVGFFLHRAHVVVCVCVRVLFSVRLGFGGEDAERVFEEHAVLTGSGINYFFSPKCFVVCRTRPPTQTPAPHTLSYAVLFAHSLQYMQSYNLINMSFRFGPPPARPQTSETGETSASDAE